MSGEPADMLMFSGSMTTSSWTALRADPCLVILPFCAEWLALLSKFCPLIVLGVEDMPVLQGVCEGATKTLPSAER